MWKQIAEFGINHPTATALLEGGGVWSRILNSRVGYGDATTLAMSVQNESSSNPCLPRKRGRHGTLEVFPSPEMSGAEGGGMQSLYTGILCRVSMKRIRDSESASTVLGAKNFSNS
jgi:hypothetical protein